MTTSNVCRALICTGALSCTLLQLGCKIEDAPSSAGSGYTFLQDLDAERRILRISASSEQPAECAQANLPIDTDVSWRQTLLNPARHRALIDLMSDEARIPYYEADTAISIADKTLICTRNNDGSEFCYSPKVVVTRDDAPWRFSLEPEIRLSAESRELIDEFLSAHDECMNPTTQTNGGG